ncbi:MAG: CocE/NonD family hydrolase [Pseudonocardiales bacterium]|nr:CocE/NonD family hydrolase [Pseudonocardiales bacterium]MBV9028855.1 CocE/NonD family hydrolase [Pseudonocardiales bacterium]MBW0010765.1 CocE/NonD family hydrolase [Pseudonocardiales bacterium]
MISNRGDESAILGATRLNLRLTVPDGTALATDVYLPEPQHLPAPTVITRTPYGKMTHLREGIGWARHGFAYVTQDVRGRYDSDGHWVPYQGERRDGHTTLDWVLRRPWCDGRLIAAGASYAAYTAWALARHYAHPGTSRAEPRAGDEPASSEVRPEWSAAPRRARPVVGRAR